MTTHVLNKKIGFLTGTRADFGKQLPLIREAAELNSITVYVTGMHLLDEYGKTVIEVMREARKVDAEVVHLPQTVTHNQAETISKTVDSLLKESRFRSLDLFMLHGDRAETLGGAIASVYNDVLTGHVEGGEISGTIDESTRHAVSKLAHVHFTSNAEASQRLWKMGEHPQRIFEIGSPEVDVMLSGELPSLDEVLHYYKIPNQDYCIIMYHPSGNVEFDALVMDQLRIWLRWTPKRPHAVIIWPNNDPGVEVITSYLRDIRRIDNVTMLPSMRFSYFVRLMASARWMMGNSSCMVREAPVFGTPSIVLGDRQRGRAQAQTIIEGDPHTLSDAIWKADNVRRTPLKQFGDGSAAFRFGQIIYSEEFWNIPLQKVWSDGQEVANITVDLATSRGHTTAD